MPQLVPQINFASQPFRATLGKDPKVTRAAKLGFVGRTTVQGNAKNLTAHSNTGVPRVANLDMQPSIVRVDEIKRKVMSPCPTKWLQEIAPTPIKINVLKRYLQTYPNRADRFILLNGFTFGFRLGYTGPRITRDSPCLKSARGQPDIVLSKLLKEREKGRIAGPFYEKPLPNLQCSPLGLVPKKQPGEYRLIHHLSYPNGASINDFIDDKLCKVKYSSFDDAISMISELNGQIFLGKLDKS